MLNLFFDTLNITVILLRGVCKKLGMPVVIVYSVCVCVCVCVCVAQSCPTLCNPMDCRSPGSSVHGILQARKLEWVAISFSTVYDTILLKCVFNLEMGFWRTES